LNLISSSLQDAVKAAGVSNYVMGIVGVKVDGKLSLQQTRMLPATDRLKDAPKSNIGQYLYSNTLTGIFIMLFIVAFMVIGFLQLMVVQTPTYFPTENIDFGKIEK
jgi:hypothetical protein